MTMPTQPDLSSFTDEQLMQLLNVPGAMYHLAANELARRNPIPERPAQTGDDNAAALQGAFTTQPS